MSIRPVQRYAATPRLVSGTTRHFWRDGETNVEVTALPARLLIDDHGPVQGSFLYRFDDAGTCFADTWHRTVDDARVAAEKEFGVPPSDWSEIAVGDS